jgi:septum site-determining protein MinC
MSKNSIMIKGNKYGFVIVMDSETPFEQLKEQLAEKLKGSEKFLGNGTMAVSFEGRTLENSEQRELLDIISDSSELHIACVIDEDEKLTEVFKKSVEKIEKMVDNGNDTIEEPQPRPRVEMPAAAPEESGNTGKFFRGTLRSGQFLESDTSVVIIGDVNPGAKVSAGGNVIILGSLKGTVSAGLGGDNNAFIVALDMAPVQVRIGDTIARCSEKPKKAKAETKIAYLDNGNIFIDPLSRDLLNVLKF